MSHLVWVASPVGNACRLESLENHPKSYLLAKGLPLGPTWPKDAQARMSRTFKKATALTDDLMILNKGVKVCSPRLVDFLKREGIEQVEYLPLTILDHKGKVASKEYFVVNPVAPRDALDLPKSEPDFNLINPDQIDSVARIVLLPDRLTPKDRLFRLKGFTFPVLVAKDLAEAMTKGGLVGPYFKSLEHYAL